MSAQSNLATRAAELPMPDALRSEHTKAFEEPYYIGTIMK
jgi:hypothetical protein